MTSASKVAGTELRGIAAAPGRVAAPAWRWDIRQVHDDTVDLTGEAGITRLQIAVREGKAALTSKAATLEANGAASEAGVLEAQALILDDPALLDGASEPIREGKPADTAGKATTAPFPEMLRAADDVGLPERAREPRAGVGQQHRTRQR